MPQPIQNPRVSSALARAFGLVGRVRPALDEVIVPVVSIGDLSEGESPAVARRASGFVNQAPVAGERPVVRFEIPGNVIAVIDQIYIRLSAAGFLRIFHGSSIPIPPNIAPKSYTDGRLLDSGEIPAAEITHGTQIPALAASHELYYIASGAAALMTRIPTKIVVGSGRQGQFGFIELAADAVAVDLQATFTWTEYHLT